MNYLPSNEKNILKFWERKKIFEKSIKKSNKPFFSFYDGPPFATGIPHYGHILATTIKDSVLRYWAMKGYRVPRRVGWDCHGLPIENLIEKEMKIKSKKEIEDFGVGKFNELCRNSVFRCVKDFEITLKRVGRWADYKDSYATLDNKYIESVWWVFSELWKKGLIYKDYRVIPFCPRCGTPISNFEVNQGYKDVKDNSIYIKFKIKDSQFKDSYFLSWTTTPWTLPGNVALAVNPKADYCLIEKDREKIILMENRLSVLDGKYKKIKKFKGIELKGIKYEPLFNCLENVLNIENAFIVLPAAFVSTEEGTGIVHTAVMYGQDDFELGKKYNLPAVHTVDQSGKFNEKVEKWKNRFVKDVENEIIDDLDQRKFLYKKEKMVHSYPFCWRCDTILLYYAFETWYISVSKIKKNLVSNNKKIYWVPNHIKTGRFGKWISQARDWAFSRNRFWGAPIPIWICTQDKKQKNQKFKKCNNIKIISSIKELERLSKKKIKDLHRPYIDEIKLKCSCGHKMKRIEEVFDCWFESGSMPYAQWHYPFENKKFVEKTFPADFIAEGLDQTRGWFYTLHVLAAALTLKNKGLGKNNPAFKNAIVNGLVLDSTGKKLSKRLKNYPETDEIFEKYGADSLRFFLLSSTPIGEDYLFSAKGVENIYRNIISTFWHSYIFFNTYKDKKFKPQNNFKPENNLDKWIISRINSLNKETCFWMDKFDLTKASRPIIEFIDDFSNWYVRRSRKKMQNILNDKEKQQTSDTFYQVLIILSKIIAPFTPFVSEFIYQEIKTKKDPESVHLNRYPNFELKKIDKKLELKMKKTREIVKIALAQRTEKGIKVRQPLNQLTINNQELKKEIELLELIKDEVNVKKIIFGNKIVLDTKITLELKEEGIVREIIRQIQQKRKQDGLMPQDEILVKYFGEEYLTEIFNKNEKFILKEARIKILEDSKNELTEAKEVIIENKKLFLFIKKI